MAITCTAESVTVSIMRLPVRVAVGIISEAGFAVESVIPSLLKSHA